MFSFVIGWRQQKGVKRVTLKNAVHAYSYMRVVNRDADTVIANVERKDSMVQKFMGLRFRTEGRAFFSFRRPTRAAIDMAFVRCSLDIAFLNEDMEILEIHGAFPLTLEPATWRVYRPSEPYKYALEVEKELLQEKGFEEGHTLDVLD